MKVTIKDNKMTIEIDVHKPVPSSTGKTLVIASTGGNQATDAKVDGKTVMVGMTAYIKP